MGPNPTSRVIRAIRNETIATWVAKVVNVTALVAAARDHRHEASGSEITVTTSGESNESVATSGTSSETTATPWPLKPQLGRI